MPDNQNNLGQPGARMQGSALSSGSGRDAIADLEEIMQAIGLERLDEIPGLEAKK